MSELTLNVQTGRPTGTRNSRRLRREGIIPGTVYGLEADPVSVAVPWPELRAALTTDAGLNAILQLEMDGEQSQMAMVKELQRHPVRYDVLHVDFVRIDADAEVEVEVPLTLIGDARKVTDADGMVDQTLFALLVLAKPGSIPNELEADISGLEIGEAVRVGDLDLPAGTRTEVDPDEPVAVGTMTRSTLEQMRIDEEAEEAEEGAGDEAEARAAEADESAE